MTKVRNLSFNTNEYNPLSQREVRNTFQAQSKESYLKDLLSARPKDYQERNQIYNLLSILVSYPLQAVSVCAGSYLLYDIAQFVWKIELASTLSYFTFLICFSIFFGIESLRRWLVNTTGYHYLATFTIQKEKLQRGEWLRTKLYVLWFISILLICSGTYGTYLFIKHNSPQAQMIDVVANLNPIEQKIQSEASAIQSIDKQVAQLQQTKKTELADKNSYLVWNGTRYLSPTVKQRHDNYDIQINKMLSQKERHQDLMNKLEQRATEKEKNLEGKNEKITLQNNLSKESYAFISSCIWLCFEILLIFMLSYTWIFKYGIKREYLVIELRKKTYKYPIEIDVQIPKPKRIELNTKKMNDNVRTNAKKAGISESHIEHNLKPFDHTIEPIEVEQEEVLNSIQVKGFVRYDERSNAEKKANVRTKPTIEHLNNVRSNSLRTKWKCTENKLFEMYKKGLITTVSEGEGISGMSRGKVASIRKKAIG